MKKITIKELEYLAFHDLLTGLKNRSYLYRRADFSKYSFVYFIDINNMHEINKSGHFFGDRHILRIIKDISAFLNKKDLLIRYAGDEFVVLTKNEIDIKSNKDFSVGKTEISTNDILKEIEKADRIMLESKKYIEKART
jgi:diguanylate cyclase (GGDEF)-like protein